MKRINKWMITGVLLGLMFIVGCTGTKGRNEAELEGIRILYDAGVASYGEHQYAQAQQSFEQAIRACGKLYDETYAELNKYYGACLYELGRYRDALEAFRLAQEYGDPAAQNMAGIYYLEGCCYIKLSDENSAVTKFEAALKSETPAFETYCNMYERFMEAGYTERAESYLKRIISAPDASPLLVGKTFFYLKRYDEAETFLLRAIDAGDIEGAYYLGMCYEAKADYAVAETYYQNYVARNETDPVGMNQYGVYLMNRGRYEDALGYFERGLALEQSDEVHQALLYNRANCYEYLSDYERARELFREYVKLYPEDEKAARELLFLESR